MAQAQHSSTTPFSCSPTWKPSHPPRILPFHSSPHVLSPDPAILIQKHSSLPPPCHCFNSDKSHPHLIINIIIILYTIITYINIVFFNYTIMIININKSYLLTVHYVSEIGLCTGDQTYKGPPPLSPPLSSWS